MGGAILIEVEQGAMEVDVQVDKLSSRRIMIQPMPDEDLTADDTAVFVETSGRSG